MSRARIALELRDATRLVRSRMDAEDWEGVVDADLLLRQALDEATRLPLMSPPLLERIEQARVTLREARGTLAVHLGQLADDMARLQRRRAGASAYARHGASVDDIV